MIPGAWRSCTILARLGLRRALRRNSIWVSLGLIVLPWLFATGAIKLAEHSGAAVWTEIYSVVFMLYAVLPPLLVSSVVAEELENETITYLWSRPIPRSTVLFGKLLGLIPLLIALFAAATAGAWAAVVSSGLADTQDLVRGIAAASAGAAAFALVSAAIGTLVPKHPVATSVAYVLVLDLPMGSLPFSLGKLAVSHHISIIAGVSENSEAGSVASALVWLLGLCVIWGAVAMWRVARGQLSTRGA